MAVLIVRTGFFVSSTYATAGINQTINFQGKLVDNNGLNVANGNYDVIFYLYAASSGGSPLWTETWNSGTTQVAVQDGVFRVALGTHTVFTSFDFNTDSLYLAIKVGADTEMTPRIRFTSVPYAFVAKTVVDDALDFAQLQDTLDVDANLTVNQTGYTWTQTYTGTSAPGLSYTASGAVSSGNAAALDVNVSNASTTVPAMMLTNAGSGFALRINDDGNTNDSTPLVVDANGNVGIGTTSPDSNLEIAAVNPIIAINSTTAGVPSLAFEDGGTFKTAIYWDRTSNKLTLDGGGIGSNFLGNVGIGTTGPLSKLHIYNGSSGAAAPTSNTGLTLENNNQTFLQVLVPNAVNASSGLVIGDDTNTYRSGLVYNPTTNLTTYSAGAFYTKDGNVGIGTVTPQAKLQVLDMIKVSDSATQQLGRFILGNGGSTVEQVGLFRGASDGTYTAGNTLNLGAYESMNFNTGYASIGSQSVRMTILNGGNVGIGTTGPGAPLEIKPSSNVAQLRLTQDNDATQYSTIFRDSSDGSTRIGNHTYPSVITFTNTANVNINSGQLYVQQSIGNVGIGTTGPGAKLDVRGAYDNTVAALTAAPNGKLTLGSVDTTNAILNAGITSGYAWLQTRDQRTGQTWSGDIALNPLGGNVGIGTTSPTARLNVSVTQAEANGGLSAFNIFDGYYDYHIGWANKGTSGLSFYGETNEFYVDTRNGDVLNLAQSGSPKLTIRSGNVGIGTTAPSYKFDVSGGSGIVGQFSGRVIGGDAVYSNEFATLGQIATGGGGPWSRTAPNVYLTTGTDNVGIGTTAPFGRFQIGAPAGSGTGVLSNVANIFGTYESNRGTLGLYTTDVATADYGPVLTFGGESGGGTTPYRYAAIKGAKEAGSTWGGYLSFNTTDTTSAYNERMRITSTGNVGIGTTATRAKLDIYSNTFNSPLIRLENYGQRNAFPTYSNIDTGYIDQYFYNASGPEPWKKFLDIVSTGSDAGNIRFLTNSASGNATEKMRIDGSGYVGIGTTSPNRLLEVFTSGDAQFPLRVTKGTGEGGIEIGVNGWYGSIRTYEDSSPNGYMSFNTATGFGTQTEVMRLKNNGNVGIGTTAPGSKLDVSGGISWLPGVTGNPRGILTGSSAEQSIQIGTNTANGLSLITDSSTRLFIQSTGNVGIGTTAPNRKLHIASTDGAALTVTADNAKNSLEFYSSSYDSYLDIKATNSGSYDSRIRLYNPSNNYLQVEMNAGNYGFFGYNGAENLVINSSGNVGIGTTAPLAKLEIGSGNVAAANVGYSTGAPTLVSHFDGPKPDETDFTGNPNGNLGQVATVTGGVIHRPGKFGKAVQIAEATTNLVVNPSLEVDSGNWGFDSPVARSTTGGYVGSASIKIPSGSASGYSAYYTSSANLSPLTQYTGSVWVKGKAGDSLTLTIGFYNGGWTWTPTSVTATGDWQRITTTVTSPASWTQFQLRVQANSTLTGDAYADAFQIEQKAYATPYADGSLGNGHSWSGTAHISASSRTAASLWYGPNGNVDVNKGSIAAWFYTNVSGTTRYIIGDHGGANYLNLWINSSNQLVGSWGSNSPAVGGSVSANTWNHAVVTSDGTTVTIYLNGVQVASGAAGSHTSFGNIGIGYEAYAGNGQINGLIDDVAIFPTALSAQEIYSIYKSNAPIQTEDQSSSISAREILSVDGRTILGTTGNVGIGVTNPSEKLEIAGNLKFQGSSSITSTGTLTIGTGSTALNLNSSGTVNVAQNLSSSGTVNATGGYYVGATQLTDSSGNISGDRVGEIVTARTTYSTLNDRLNGIVTNYSSVMSNSNMKSFLFNSYSDINTTNTTAYLNTQIGSLQNDATAWSYGTPTSGFAYGDGAPSMGSITISGNYLYQPTWSYGVKVYNLATNTIYKEYNTSSTPALPQNYYNDIAYDSVNNDIYAGSWNGGGLVKIDVDANTATSYTTGNSSILSDQMFYYDNSLQYYNGKVYLFPYPNYMQVFNVSSQTFTNYGSATGLPAHVYHTQKVGNKLHISGEGGFYIWNMDTDTLEARYCSGCGTNRELNSYTNSIYSSIQDPSDSDAVWISGYRHFQKVSKTTGTVTGTFHRTDVDTGLATDRWSISRVGSQIWLGSQYGQNPKGYLVYDLNAQNYFVAAATGQVIGNTIGGADYNFQFSETYNGYYYIPTYWGWIWKSNFVYEASNAFETNTLLTSIGNNYTTAKFDYTGGTGSGNSLTWYISADNGAHWEGPVGVNALWPFANPGTQIKLKATMAAGTGTTPIIRSINVLAYDGATWAGQGSTTVETEVLQARNSSTFGIFGSVDLRLEDLDARVLGASLGSHNHDDRYLQLTGGTLSGALTVNANLYSNNILANANNLYDLGSSTAKWKDLWLGSNAYIAGNVGIGTTTPGAKLHTSGGYVFIDLNEASVAPAQLQIRGVTNTNQELMLGYNTTSDYGSIQAFLQGVGAKPLVLQNAGGNVGIGTTSPQGKLSIRGGAANWNTTFETSDYAYGSVGSRLTLGHGTTTGNTYSALQAETGGSTAVGNIVFNPNGGNVGIGTTSPQTKLHVYGGTGSSQLLMVGEGSSTGERGLNIGYNYNSDYSWFQSTHQDSGYTPIVFNANGGNVGIGTTGPVSALQVNGAITSGATGGNYGSLDLLRTSDGSTVGRVYTDSANNLNLYQNGGSGVMSFLAGGVEKMRLDQSGNVGIGTTSPKGRLDVDGGGNFHPRMIFSADGADAALRLYRTDGSTGWTAWHITGGDGSYGEDLSFKTGYIGSGDPGTETVSTKMVILNTGEVGIGTTNPGAKLEVKSSAVSTAPLRLTASDGSVLGQVWEEADGRPYLQLFDAAQNSKVIIDTGGNSYFNGGNVGIGTTEPDSKLNVVISDTTAYSPTTLSQGVNASDILNLRNDNASANFAAIRFSTKSSGASIGRIAFLDNGAQGDFAFMARNAAQTYTTELMRIQGTSGNVGIGTTAPGAKLDVNGTAIIKSGLTLDGQGGQLRFRKTDLTDSGDDLGIWNSDTSNLFYIADWASGTKGLTINTSSGYVGIGTASPLYSLDIGDATGVRAVRVKGGAGTAEGGAFYVDGTVSIGDKSAILGSGTDHDAWIYSYGKSLNLSAGSATPHMTVLTNGNVGIGITNPQALLNTYKTPTAGFVEQLRIGGTNNYESLSMGTYGGYDAWIGTYGNDLHLYGGNWRTIGATATEDHNLKFYTSQAGSTNWSTPKMILNSAGNVGIGTTNTAGYKLNVAGNATFASDTTGQVSLYNTAGGSEGGTINLVSNGGLSTFLENANGTFRVLDSGWTRGNFTVDQSGNIGSYNNITAGGGISTYDGVVADNTVETGQLCLGNGTNCISSWGITGVGRKQLETDRTIGATTGDTVALGYFSSDGVGKNIKIQLKAHNNGTIDVLTFEIDEHAYIGNTTDWLEVPLAHGVSYSGTRRLAVDVYRQNIGSPSDPLYVRIRNKDGAGTGTVQAFIDYDDDSTLTELSLQSTVATAFNATTAPAGGVVTGLKGNVEWTFPVSNGFAWSATTKGLYITNPGNVGIGTTSPSMALDVAGTGVVIDNNAYYWQRSAGGTANGLLQLDTSNDLNIAPGGEIQDVLFKQQGNVGIGSTAPGAKLDVAGTLSSAYMAKFANNASWGHGIEVLTSDVASMNSIYAHSAISGSDFVVQSSGNVGIGTASPTNKLHLIGSSNDTINVANLNVKFQGSGGNGIGFGTLASSPYRSYIQSGYLNDFGAATYDLLLNPVGGNVGIGMTAPTNKLSVNGIMNTIAGSGGLYLDPTTNFWRITQTVAGSSGNLQITQDGLRDVGTFRSDGGVWLGGAASSTSPVMAIQGSGNVGIGTTAPTNKLLVQFASDDRLQLNQTANNNYGYNLSYNGSRQWDIYANGSTGDLGFYRGASGNAMTILQSSGNVGIGTASPTLAKLQVAGDVTINNTNWFNGINSLGTNQPLIRSRGMGYDPFGYAGVQVGQTGDHVALLIDPGSIAGGSFNGNNNEIMLPNVINFLQANSGGTDWIPGMSLNNGYLTVAGDLTVSGDDLFMATNTANYFLVADGTNYNPTSPADARTALGISSGGSGDIWVEKAGDTMTGTLNMSGNKITGAFQYTDNIFGGSNIGGIADNLVRANEKYTVTTATGYNGSSSIFDGSDTTANSILVSDVNSSPRAITIDLGAVQHYWNGWRLHFAWGDYGNADSFIIDAYINNAGDGNCANPTNTWTTMADVTGFTGADYTTNTGASWVCKIRVTLRHSNATNGGSPTPYVLVGTFSGYQKYYGDNGLYTKNTGDTIYGDLNVGTAATNRTLSVNGSANISTNTYMTSGAARLFLGATAGYGVINRGQTTGGTSTQLYIGEPSDTGQTFFRGSGAVTTEGSVGIGTTGPAYQLQVAGAGQTTSNLTDAGNKGGSLYLYDTGGGAGDGGAILFGAVSVGGTPQAAIKSLLTNGSSNGIGDLAFSTRNAVGDTALTERMRILSGGNVGIGTTSPTTKLYVSGAITASIGNANALEVYNNSAGAGAIFVRNSGGGWGFYDDTSPKHYFNGAVGIGYNDPGTAKLAINGNVGIGTISPTGLLDVYGGSGLKLRQNGDFEFNALGSTNGTQQQFSIRSNSSASVHINTQNSARLALGVSTGSSGSSVVEQMTINSSGNVGIGTTNPGTLLDLYMPYASDTTTTALRLTRSGYGFQVGGGLINGVGSYGTFSTVHVTNGVVEAMRIDPSGNVGIGTTDPGTKLDVVGGAIRTDANGYTSNNVGGTGTASYHPGGIYSASTNWLYGAIYLNGNLINDIGNVGTDFTSGGGLTLAGTFDPNGAITFPTTGISGAGSGSGLDADLLDNIDSSRIVYGSNEAKVQGGGGVSPNTPFSTYGSGFIDVWSGADLPSGTSHIQGFSARHSNTANQWGIQVAGQYDQGGTIFTRGVSAGTWSPWYKLWSEANDGSGSGLDADLLDGQNGSYYNAYANLTDIPTRSAWSGVHRGFVAEQLSWKNYGNNHTIFDASAGTSPQGTAVNNTNSEVAWSATYPTLMGWNGGNTYGVRVDSARIADTASGFSHGGTTNYVAKFTGATSLGNSLIFDNGTNVGIGTTSPLSKLEVAGGPIYQSNTGASQIILNSSGSYYGGIQNSASQKWSLAWGGSPGSTALGNSVLTWGSDNSVGIGTTAPTSGYTLDVNGAMMIDANDNAYTGGLALDRSFPVHGSLWVDSDGGTLLSYMGYYGHKWETNGGEGMRLMPGGLLGIGTTSPQAVIHAVGGAAMTGGWNRTSVLQSTYPVQVFNSNNTKWGGIGYDYSGGMAFWVNAASQDVSSVTPSMYVNNSGNVGIGTAAPQAWAKLEVAGNAYLNSGHLYLNNGYQSGRWGDSTTFIQGSGQTTSGYLNLTVNNIPGLYINGSGNVGVNTTSPTSKMTIYNSVAGNLLNLNSMGSDIVTISDTQSTFNNPTAFTAAGDVSMAYDLVFTNPTSANILTASPLSIIAGESWGSSNLTLGTYGAGDIIANLTGTGRFLVPTGNVGIGTTSPGASLDIRNGGTTPQLILGDTGSSTTYYKINRNTGTGVLDFQGMQVGAVGYDFKRGDGTSSLYINTAGNVGIGTSAPLSTLEVNGVGSFSLGTASLPGISFNGDLNTGVWSSGADSVSLSTAGVERMRVASNGYVGFGITPSSYPLESSTDDWVTNFRLSKWNNNDTGAGMISLRGRGTKASPSDVQDEDALATYAFQGYYNGSGRGAARIAANVDVAPSGTNIVPGRLTFSTANTSGTMTEIMRIDSAGYVGIGTTGPSTKLQVAGDISPSANDTYDLGTTALRFKDLYLGGDTLHLGTSLTDEGTLSYNTTSNVFNFGTDSTTNGDIAFFTDDLYLDKSTGYVGIGTTAPTAQLSVAGASSSISNAAGDLTITPAGNLIISSGFVGIGTVYPNYKLDVYTDTTYAVANFENASAACYINPALGGFECSSDVRLKKNIVSSDRGLDTIMNLRPVEFNWNSQAEGDQKYLGFIAQEVEEVAPYLVSTDDKGYKRLNSMGIIPVLAKAIQEQQGILRQAQDDIQAMHVPDAKIATVSAKLENLNSKVSGWDGLFISIQSIIQSIQEAFVAIQNQLGFVRSDIQSTKEQVASLSASLTDIADWKEAVSSGGAVLGATDSAMLGEVATASSLMVKNNLQVDGKTTLFDLTVLNKLTSGVIQIGAGIDGDEINASTGIRFQTLAQGPVDFMNGKVVIDVDGSISAKHFKLDTLDATSSTGGKAIMPAGEMLTTVETTSINADSMVYVTIQGDYAPASRYWVTNQVEGDSFMVQFDRPTTRPVEFSWFIIN